MDKAIFQFNTSNYERKDVEHFSRQMCEKLADIDSENVTKFDLQYTSLQDILNEIDYNSFDFANCWFRVFIGDE